MHKVRKFLGLFIGSVACLLLLLPVQSQADISLDVCKIYFSGSSEIPLHVAMMMRERRDTAAEGCLTNQILHSYASVSATFSGAFNVCSYFKYERLRFDDLGNDITNERYRHDTETFMAIAGPNCPAQSDSRFILASNISEGVFARLVAFADQVGSSTQAFDSALTPDAKRIRCGHDLDATARKDLMDLTERNFQMLRRKIASVDVRSKFRLREIGLQAGAVVMQGGGIFRQCSGYALSFSDPLEAAESWTLYVEFTPEGLRIIGYARFIA